MSIGTDSEVGVHTPLCAGDRFFIEFSLSLG